MTAGPLCAGSEPRLEVVPRLGPDLQVRVDALARAARAADGGVSPFGEHKWLRLVHGDDRGAALILWQDGEVVGAAQCDVFRASARGQGPHPGDARALARAGTGPRRLTAEVVVHPLHRGRGLGRRLLDGVDALAHEQGVDELHLWAYGNGPAARRLVSHFGFLAERTLLQMVLPRERLPGPPALPPDVRLRSFDPPRDAYPWLMLHNRVFEGHPEQGNWQAGDLQARLEQPWFNARDLLLLERPASGALVGFCWVKLSRDASAPGEIYIVGVDPPVRRSGLGRVATQAGLAHIAAAGRPAAMLYVEADNVAAVAMYERLGFERRWEHVCYSRRL
jgi:mycothiol synthase